MTRHVLLVEIGGKSLPNITPVQRPASNWVPSVKPGVVIPPAEGVETTPGADSVTITWEASPLPGAVYVVWRAPDVNGKPGVWEFVTRTSDTRYTYADVSGAISWWKITVLVNGISSGDSTAAPVAPVVPPTTQELVDLQRDLDRGLLDLALADAREAEQRATGIAAAQAEIVALRAQQGAAIIDVLDKVTEEESKRVQALLNQKLELRAEIAEESTRSQTADESLARQVSSLAAGSGTQFDSAKIWHFDATIEGWQSNGGNPTIVDGWLRAFNNSTPWIRTPTAPIAVDGAAYRFMKMRIRKVGTPNWAGQVRWITDADQTFNDAKLVVLPAPSFDANGVSTLDVSDIPWNSGSPIRAIRIQLGGPQTAANYIEFDWIAIGRPSPGASVAMLEQDRQATNTAIAAEASQRDTLAAQLRGSYTGSDFSQVTQGFMADERGARVAADGAQVKRLETMEARMPAGTGGLATSSAVTNLQNAMVAADQANAQATTAVSSRLNGLRTLGDNLIPNSGFADDFLWWVVGGNSGGNTILRDAASGDGGPGVTITRATASTAPFMDANDGAWYPVQAGTIFRARLRVKLLSGNGNILLRIIYRNVENVQAQVDRSITATSAWTDFTVDYGALPAGSVRALFRVYVHPAVGTVSFDRVELYDITDQVANQLTANGLSALTTEVSSVKGTQSSQAALINQVQTELQGKASNTAMSSLDGKVTQIGDSVTSQGSALTAVTGKLDAIGGDNLLLNPSFEESTSATAVPLYYVTSSSNTFTVGYVPSTLPGSTRALRITRTVGNAADYFGVELASAYRPKVVVGQKYVNSVWARGKAGQRLDVYIQYVSASGAAVGVTVQKSYRITAAWQRYFAYGDAAPAGAVAARVIWRIHADAIGDQLELEIDNAMFQQGEVATNWVPSGADVAAALAASAAANSSLTGKVSTLEGTTTALGQAVTTTSAKLSSLGDVVSYGITSNAQLLASPSGGPRNTGIRNAAGGAVAGAGRGFGVCLINADSSLGPRNGFDTYNDAVTASQAMADFIATIPDNQYFIVYTGDHLGNIQGTSPATAALRAALIDAGGSVRAVAAVNGVRMYILIGRRKLGAGAGIEVLCPVAPSGRVDQWCEYNLQVLNGVPVGMNDQRETLRGLEATSDGLSALTSTVTQQGGQISAQSTQLNQVQASVAGKADSSVVASMSAAVASIGRGGNLITNSTFPNWQRNGWGWYSNPHGFRELGDPTGDASWSPTGVTGIGSIKPGVLPNGYDGYFGTEYFIGIEGGKTYCVSAYMSNHRCSMALYAEFYDVTGKIVGSISCPYNSARTEPPVTLSRLARPFAIGKAPANAATARIVVRVVGNGESDPYFWLWRPMLSEVGDGATSAPPWSAGGSESSASWQVMMNTDGYVSGLQLTAKGQTSQLNVLASAMNILSPGGADGIEMTGGYLRVWKGNSQRIIGNGFGNPGEGLMDYFGPNVGAAAASKANATVWMDVNGSAYWGGSLAAGVLRNAVQTTTTNTVGSSVTTGIFSTNGRNKSVVVSFSRNHNRRYSAMGSTGFVAGGGANTCTVNIYRTINGQAEQFWQQFTAGGSVSIFNEWDGPDDATSYWAGSMTINDNADGSAQRSYRAEIVGFTSQDVSHSSGSFNQQTITQSLSIVSTEI